MYSRFKSGVLFETPFTLTNSNYFYNITDEPQNVAFNGKKFTFNIIWGMSDIIFSYHHCHNYRIYGPCATTPQFFWVFTNSERLNISQIHCLFVDTSVIRVNYISGVHTKYFYIILKYSK
jgi:hypothetical protein